MRVGLLNCNSDVLGPLGRAASGTKSCFDQLMFLSLSSSSVLGKEQKEEVQGNSLHSRYSVSWHPVYQLQRYLNSVKVEAKYQSIRASTSDVRLTLGSSIVETWKIYRYYKRIYHFNTILTRTQQLPVVLCPLFKSKWLALTYTVLPTSNSVKMIIKKYIVEASPLSCVINILTRIAWEFYFDYILKKSKIE